MLLDFCRDFLDRNEVWSLNSMNVDAVNVYNVLLLACYELGHQPLSLAWPLAALAEADLSATALDLSVQDLSADVVAQADFVGIAVPMHTALRLGVDAARQVRAINPDAHICFYGLYARLNADYLLAVDNGASADSVIAGEYEQPLIELVRTLRAGGDPSSVPAVSTAGSAAEPHLARLTFPLPQRAGLPPLDRYARYVQNGTQTLAGYVESSRGCLHTCRHCPVVPIYNGRFFVVPAETVLADIAQQVEAGARHITFGDPDFLNGPGHALQITRALHQEFPQITFDFTTKVEHILEKRDLIPELRALGASFVVSAFESVSDRVLARLVKGHTAANMDQALAILADAGLPVQPTWVPFTPWTSLDDYLLLLDWIRTRNLIPAVPAVQLSIRLLVPPQSALLDQPDTERWLGELDAANFTYRWRHPDPRVDELQRQVAAFVERAGDDAYANFAAIEELAYAMAGKSAPAWEVPAVSPVAPPRLSEDWFC